MISNKVGVLFLLASLCIAGCDKKSESKEIPKEGSEVPAAPSISDAGAKEADTAGTDTAQPGFSRSIEGYKATSLGEAIHSGSLELVKEQLRKGASIESCLTNETYVFDALYSSLAFGKYDVLEYLIENKLYSDINKTYTEEADCPLTLACEFQTQDVAIKMATLLISKGAKVNGVGESGGDETKFPLFEAVYQNNAPLVKFLLEQGAQKDIMNLNGETPLSKAEADGSTEIIELLM